MREPYEKLKTQTFPKKSRNKVIIKERGNLSLLYIVFDRTKVCVCLRSTEHENILMLTSSSYCLVHASSLLAKLSTLIVCLSLLASLTQIPIISWDNLVEICNLSVFWELPIQSNCQLKLTTTFQAHKTVCVIKVFLFHNKEYSYKQ